MSEKPNPPLLPDLAMREQEQERAKKQLDALVAAAALLREAGYTVVKEAPHPPPIEAVSPWAKPTWAQTILTLLRDAGGCLPRAELLHRIETSPVFSALTPGYRNFYATVERLGIRQEIAIHDGVIYLRADYEERKAKGALLPKATTPRGARTRDVIVNILKEHPEGLTEQQAIDALKASPDAPRKTKKNRETYARDSLAAAERLGRVVRSKDGLYRLPKKPVPLKRMKGARFDGTPSRAKNPVQMQLGVATAAQEAKDKEVSTTKSKRTTH